MGLFSRCIPELVFERTKFGVMSCPVTFLPIQRCELLVFDFGGYVITPANCINLTKWLPNLADLAVEISGLAAFKVRREA